MAPSPQREPDQTTGSETVPSFEESFATLEAIVRQLEDGSLGLTQSLARYEEGIRCLKLCHETLRQAERRVELVTGVAADGTPVTATFDEGDLSLDEKAQQRSRRRSKGDGDSETSRGSKVAREPQAAAGSPPRAAATATTATAATPAAAASDESTSQPPRGTAADSFGAAERAGGAGGERLEDRAGPGRLFYPS